MLIRYKSTGRTRNVPKVRANALIKTGAAQPVKDNTYQTRDMRAETDYQTKQLQPEDVQPENINKLRADYQDLYGKRPFMGWDEVTLRQKIDEALEE